MGDRPNDLRQVHRARLREYIAMLDKIPEDSILGRLCIKSYIKKEKKILEELRKEHNGQKGN